MSKIAALLIFAASASAQLSPQETWAVQSQNHYAIRANIVYGTWSGYEAKLDVYQRRDAQGPQPTVMFIHGGGWVLGTKEASVMSIVPWLEMGWNVVNVEYRLSHVALAPAAVEDCLCALRWIAIHAKDYNFDLTKLILTGESAGGHLALTTGMIPPAAGFDRQCPGASFTNAGGPPLPKPAAIINWYGITDLNDMLDGPNTRAYAVEWFGSLPNREDLARRLSPLTYVRKDLPPILTIQGDADPIVPYSNATKLRDALTSAGVPNQLHTVPGGGHGNFKADDRVKIYITIHDFLTKNHII
ncbi:MAG: alpha/beta hydrolase [Acidobacteriia bacterium]|nr:alpha/beta hydrolase [Terriglobia bacterium]